MQRSYGYNDSELVRGNGSGSTLGKAFSICAAVVLIFALWLALNQKLLFGKEWISATYDNSEWRTNEGGLSTYGAWDFEAHVWKTEFILKYFPHFNWNPFWYMGMPLLEYYQPAFYAVHAAVMFLTGLSAPKAALMLVIFGHLLATYVTFLLCYKLSRRVWISAMCAAFLLSNTFVTLRSYGWEPITVVFLFLYPLGLLFFFKEPLKPFRASVIITLAVSYLAHPLIFFALAMTMGVYLLIIAITAEPGSSAANTRYLLGLAGAVAVSLLLSAVQFIPQLSYNQVTSGAHMGVKYLPFYQVPYNIITPQDFFLDAGNLKGPGPIIIIATLLILIFFLAEVSRKKYSLSGFIPSTLRTIRNHELVCGLAGVLAIMVLLYYLERFNVFPMNILRSIQYHRIIPEFVIVAAALIAALSNIAITSRQKIAYASLLFAFILSSGIIVYNVQEKWATYDDISSRPEFVEPGKGRISFPYIDQSISVRSSFAEIPQTYGYYEQGITNPYNDEVFSVSSGFHNSNLMLLYLQAANVDRLYVNTEEGLRGRIVMERMNITFPLVQNGSRYAYFEIPVANPSFSQAVSAKRASKVRELEPNCRVMFRERYCGSAREEFVTTDIEEVRYLAAYVSLLEEPYSANASILMINPEQYEIRVDNASSDTAVVVKMTYDKNFVATVDGKSVPIEPFGPYFMLIKPGLQGGYSVRLDYGLSVARIAGIVVSALTATGLVMFNVVRAFRPLRMLKFKEGDLA